MKESYPVQVAEYSVGARISMEPAFVWWVPYMLKKHNCIVAKVYIQVLDLDSQVWGPDTDIATGGETVGPSKW